MNIILIGYMGCGKTTIGNNISKILNKNFVDLDTYIELNENLSISEIFKTKGEVYFRKIEAKHLKDLLSSNSDTVISLGGGTPCYSNNIKLINSFKSIYLNCPVSILSKRLLNIKSTRPVISNINNLSEMTNFVGKHLFERNVFYNKAHFKIDCNELNVEQITNKVLSILS
jgi:shikimate kinase|tara:strand:+ start:146 stop:658 length:513 start_codon:yes stop_codon:yes gene_type:complete